MAKTEPHYNYPFTPTDQHREANLFTEEYYSSTDTHIYFNDAEQTEIGYIQYELQEQLKPVYGYNSRTFDDIIIGSRIVTGSFTVPIKNKEKTSDIGQINNTNNNSYNIVTDNSIDNYNKQEEENLNNNIDWHGTTDRSLSFTGNNKDKQNTLSYRNNIKNNISNKPLNVNINSKVNNANINSKVNSTISNEDIDYDILNKLISLGYDINKNATINKYKDIIGKFQKDHNLSVTKRLNNSTKQAIENEYKKKDGKIINLNNCYGYYDSFLHVKDGRKPLTGTATILESFKNPGGQLVYKIVDIYGSEYWVNSKDVRVL